MILGEHNSENLIAKVDDSTNAAVTWKSSNTNVATIDNNGKVTAVSVGTATITATAAGVSGTCEVNVFATPQFTDFSNSKSELLFDINTDLKITGITPESNEKSEYYYIITPTNTKPTLPISNNGMVDTSSKDIGLLYVNSDENYIYVKDLDKYLELNQDLYLWVVQDIYFDYDKGYYNEQKDYITHSTKFLLEGEKLIRPELPQLNLILKYFSMGEYENPYTRILFRFPASSENPNRKFKIKIGKVTDNTILTKIKNNDYSGITQLLSYAKNSQGLYSADLTTTRENYYSTTESLFNGRELLEHKAYYYIYIVFDDEDGKFYPIEGITLGQAWFATYSNNWDLWAYTDENFEWNDLSGTYEDGGDGEDSGDGSLLGTNLPFAGEKQMLIILILGLIGTAIFFKVRSDKYKKI